MSDALGYRRMGKQVYRPKAGAPHNTCSLRALGLGRPEEILFQRGRDRTIFQACQYDHFSLAAGEIFRSNEVIDYTRMDGYIKINFWLSGRHTTVLDGFGQQEHDHPDVFIVSGPPEATKIDLINRESHLTAVALCILPEFFPTHMGLHPDELPEPLREIVVPEDRPFAFCRFQLTQDIASAARAVLAAPFEIRRDPMYSRAKCVELMCLLLHFMWKLEHKDDLQRVPARHATRLHQARELIACQFSEQLTLEQIAREVGLNRLALTSGFRRLFNMSVYDYLQKQRMERAYELLQDENNAVADVARAVGYAHPSNFSTAFNAYFGCTPKGARASRNRIITTA